MPLNRRTAGERADEDDVKGHAMRSRANVAGDETGAAPEGAIRPRASEDEDVEGHGMRSRANLAGDDDVEGHGMRSKAAATGGDEDDVEGHSSKLR